MQTKLKPADEKHDSQRQWDRSQEPTLMLAYKWNGI